MIRPLATIIEAAACIILAAVAPLSGASRRFVATAASPVLVPLLPSAKRPVPDDPGRSVDIAVRRFQPSPAGPVQIVVDAVTGARSTEIGRFAIYPQRAFAEPDGQYFRLAIQPGLKLTPATRLRIRIVPTQGDGAHASVEVDPGRMR